MKHIRRRQGAALAVFAVLVVALSACSGGSSSTNVRNATLGVQVTTVFSFVDPSDQYFIVPADVHSIDVRINGAEGGRRTAQESIGTGSAGKGGSASGTMPVTPGETLTLQVSQKGADITVNYGAGAYPDGGAGGYPGQQVDPRTYYITGRNWKFFGSGGGGSSRIYRNDQLVIIAGGGGGAGEWTNAGDGGQVGSSASADNGGTGATQSAGGKGGCSVVNNFLDKICSMDGQYLLGGSDDNAGSGGGGGYFGGGAGVAIDLAGSGGGGSSWAQAASFIGDVTYETGVQEGNGTITLNYFDPATQPPTTTTTTVDSNVTTTTAPVPPARRPCRWGGPCSVGDIGPGGGTVFFNFTGPWNAENSGPYLEVSTDSAKTEWCNVPNPYNPASTTWGSVSATNDNLIGGGGKNQVAMLKICQSGAANTVAAATWGGMNDWWLPNLLELQMLSNFFVANFHRYLQTDFAAYQEWLKFPPYKCGYLWSSNQVNARQATVVYIGNGKPQSGEKYGQSCVAGIRMFNYGDASLLPMPTTTTTSTPSTSTTTTMLATTTTSTSTTTTTLATTTTSMALVSTTNAPGTTVLTNSTDVASQTTTRSNTPSSVMATTTTSMAFVPTENAPETTTSKTTTTLPTTFTTIAQAQVAAEEKKHNVSEPPVRPVTPADYAITLPAASLAVIQTNTGGVDGAQNPDVGNFDIVLSAALKGKVTTFDIGIRLPKRAAKSATYFVRVVGKKKPTSKPCSIKFVASGKSGYKLTVACILANGKFQILNTKKMYPPSYKLMVRMPAIAGGAMLEVRSVVLGITGTPTTGIWRSRWIYMR